MNYNLGRVLPIFKGEYDNDEIYTNLDVVYYNGSSYVAKGETQGNLPTDDNNWQPIAMAGVLDPEQIADIEQQVIEYVQGQGYVIDSDYVHTDNNYTNADKTKLDGIDMSTKQDTLVSGTNIKTINNENILGSGNITIEGVSNYNDLNNKPSINGTTLTGNVNLATPSDLANKQNTLVSGTNIKTINNQSILGSGNITIEGVSNYNDLNNKPSINGTTLTGNVNLATPSDLANKQDTLVSGTNIKTINNESLLGSGNITIEGEPAVNPFKGWFDNLISLQTITPVIGDYGYVKGATTTDPVKIYECTTAGTWSDSGREVDTSNMQSFESGQAVNSVKIKNENGEMVTGDADVLSAEAGAAIYDEVVYKDIETVDFSSYTSIGKYIYEIDNNWQTSANIRSYLIPVSDLQADKLVITANENLSSIAWMISNSTSGAAAYVDGTGIEVLAAGSVTEVVIPQTAQYLYVLSNNGATSYLPEIRKISTETVKEKIEQIEQTVDENFIFTEQLDLTSYQDERGTIIPNSGGFVFSNTTNYHKLVPVSDLGSKVTVVGNTNSSVIAWLTTVPTNPVPFCQDYPSRIAIPAGQTMVYDVPEDAAYLYMLSKNTSNVGYLPTITVEGNRIDKIDKNVEQLDERVSQLEEGATTSTDIVALNDRNVVLSVLRNSKKSLLVYNSGTKNSRTLNLIHFSDLHADANNLQRIIQFRTEFTDYIDDTLCTGDMIRNLYGDSFDFWLNNQDADNILIATGNHEYYNGELVSDTDYLNQITQQQVYTKFFAPNISDWGVTQPSNAATNGLNYYYKDYATQKVRLIVIDNFRIDSAQEQFVSDALAGAKTAGYHVIMAAHYGKYQLTAIDCGFNSNYPRSSVWKPDGIDGQLDNIVSAIDTFITGGGKFVCWLCGHTHVDYFGTIQNHPNQVQINISCASDGVGSNYPSLVSYCDQDRTVGTKGQDTFNIVSVDTTMGYFRLYRIGASIDLNMRSRLALCYDYFNHVLISQR